MILCSLNPKKDPFIPKEDGEIILDFETPYFCAIGALLYLVQYTRSNITFTVNLLVRYGFAPTWR